MKSKKILITIFILSIVLVHLSFAYILADFNPINYNAEARGGQIFTFVFFNILGNVIFNIK